MSQNSVLKTLSDAALTANRGLIAAGSSASKFSRGEGTHEVPYRMQGCHRERVIRGVKPTLDKEFNVNKSLKPNGSVLAVFRGGGELDMYDTDTQWDFRQESNFQYLFGCKEPNLFGALDLITGKSYLFIPLLDDFYATWLGPIRPRDWFRDTYEIDECLYLDSPELAQLIHHDYDYICTPEGTNLDSGLQWKCDLVSQNMNAEESAHNADLRSGNSDELSTSADTNPDSKEGKDGKKTAWKLKGGPLSIAKHPKLQTQLNAPLWHAINECRAVKCDYELDLMRYCVDVSCRAHCTVMRKIYEKRKRGGHLMKEFESEAEFRYQCFLKGAARTGYNCICPCGERNATLHYGHSAYPNCEDVNQGQLKLHDMGGEYHCYTADVTCTFPVDGVFGSRRLDKYPEVDFQKACYTAVWNATVAVEKALKPGVRYGDMHRLAQRTLLESLNGILFTFDNIEDVMKVDLAGYMQPTGLGHMLGLAVHDVAGYVPGETKANYEIKQNLRLNREVQERFVLTVEPGCYFIPHMIKKMYGEEKEKFEKFLKLTEEEMMELCQVVGGIRIEDNVVVTKDGCLVLSTHVPRTIEETENFIPKDHGPGCTRGSERFVYKYKDMPQTSYRAYRGGEEIIWDGTKDVEVEGRLFSDQE